MHGHAVLFQAKEARERLPGDKLQPPQEQLRDVLRRDVLRAAAPPHPQLGEQAPHPRGQGLLHPPRGPPRGSQAREQRGIRLRRREREREAPETAHGRLDAGPRE